MTQSQSDIFQIWLPFVYPGGLHGWWVDVKKENSRRLRKWIRAAKLFQKKLNLDFLLSDWGGET